MFPHHDWDRIHISYPGQSCLWWHTSGNHHCGPLWYSCHTPPPERWKGKHMELHQHFHQKCIELLGWKENRSHHVTKANPLIWVTCDLPWRIQCQAYVHLGRSHISCPCRSQLWWNTMADCLCGPLWCRWSKICPQNWRESGTWRHSHFQSESSQLYRQKRPDI